MDGFISKGVKGLGSVTEFSLALKARGSKTYRLHVDLGPNSLFFVIPAEAGIQ
jgi:hypothetical protein